MTHFKVDIQLPLNFNQEDGGGKIPEENFFDTYEELLSKVGGISTNNTPILGSWIHPKTNRRYNDKSIVFSVIVESEDIMTASNVPKIKELINYKEKLKKRFKQHEIFMIATRCTWL